MAKKENNKAQRDLLKEIVISIAGSGADGIVDILIGKKNVNEFLIAKKLKLTINQIRNILYKLSDEGLVSFLRKKDSRKGGWYTYYWTLDSGKSLTSLRDTLQKEIENISKQINSKKTKRFYSCSNCRVEYSEENALLQNYTCPECGEVLNLKDNKEIVSSLEDDIEKFINSLEVVNRELEEISKKNSKSLARKLRAEAKEKERERLARKKKRDRLRKLEAKKAGKIKKKVKKKKAKKKIKKKLKKKAGKKK